MNRLWSVLAAMLLLSLMLSGCAPLVQADPQESLSIYASVYPIYALTDALMAGIPDICLHCLVQPQDGCLRDYQLSDWDVRLLATGADAVIMGGRGLESFENALFGWGEDGPAMSAVLYNLELYSSNHNVHGQGEAASHWEGPNPHLYMSIDGAKRMVASISATLMALDPDWGERYAENETSTLEKLDSLAEQMEGIVGGISREKVAVMNETLVYIARDWNLDVVTQIERESGQDCDAATLEAYLEQLAAGSAKVVLIERQAPAMLIEGLEAAGFGVARLDTLSTRRESEGFDGYIQAQLYNATALRRAFEEADR